MESLSIYGYIKAYDAFMMHLLEDTTNFDNGCHLTHNRVWVFALIHIRETQQHFGHSKQKVLRK